MSVETLNPSVSFGIGLNASRKRVPERRERGSRLQAGDGVGRGDGRHALAFAYV
jgi:hypothetical protein